MQAGCSWWQVVAGSYANFVQQYVRSCVVLVFSVVVVDVCVDLCVLWWCCWCLISSCFGRRVVGQPACVIVGRYIQH